jgi:uncharacterized protein (DUF2147 family)
MKMKPWIAATGSGILRIATVAFTVLGVLPVTPTWAADPGGIWLNPKGNLRVRIAPCGVAMCGTIVWLKEPNNRATGEAKTDKNNPNPANRTRPLVGVDMLLGLKPGETPGQWAGQVYLPGSGQTYDARIALEGADALKIEGCMIGGLLCRAERWTRAF